MIEKMKRTPKAKHGWKVWIKEDTLVETITTLNMFLSREEVFFVTEVQYQKPCILFYTDSDEVANMISILEK